MRKTSRFERDTLCLCAEHRDRYRSQGYKVIPAGGNSSTCDLCNYNRRGFEYVVYGFLSRTH